VRKLTLFAVLIALLIVSMPVVHAETLNLVTDANGNLITGDGFFREYNSFNQLVNVRNGSDISAPLLQQFTYHPIEERIILKQTFNNSGTSVESIYYWTKTFVEVVNLSGDYNFTFIYHEGQLVAQELQDVRQFIHGDHLGSSSIVTNSSGNVVENTTYSPYGEIVTGGVINRFDYTGKEYDSIVADYNFNARKYKAVWGIFTQPDPLLPNIYDPQQLNRYAYGRNNPYNYIDFEGHAAIWVHYSETKENYIAAGFSDADASKVAAGAIEPDLYRYSRQEGKLGFGAEIIAKYLGLDLEMEVMGAEAEYYYHEYDARPDIGQTTEAHIEQLLEDYQKAVDEGDLERMGNIEHALGHDIGSTEVPGYHAGASSYNKITTPDGTRLFHHINDVFGLTVDKNAMRAAQIGRAQQARDMIYERQVGQTAALRRHHAKQKENNNN